MEDKSMQEEQQLNDTPETNTDIDSDTPNPEENNDSEIVALKQEITDLKDKYLRQVADFDNLRKRAAKEKLETIQTAGKDVITSLLTVLDDSERAAAQLEKSQDIHALKEGLNLVFGKLRSTLQAKGLKPMESVGQDFNPEFHEAITEIPAPSPEQSGKVIDEVEKGYYLNDKIIRFAKVVVGK
jgi:molecular chaperone GrpE